MKIFDLFLADVTRDIPPVVYFHEQSPERVVKEVEEYIITGGYPEGDPRARRVRDGIHEQFVKLLDGIARDLRRNGGPDLPACWISGFYGSGKSSFAKLLGLSLDGMQLPDGTSLADALCERDDSPNHQDLLDRWQTLCKLAPDPLSVVFDIGAVARDDEPIHRAALRQVQAKLGYCPKSALVAEFELNLEIDKEWDAFEAAASSMLGRPWAEAMRDEQAEDHFSHVLHVLKPDRYPEPMSWIDSRAGYRSDGSSVRDAVTAIQKMLARRAKDRTLFLVIDEVSQYVHHDNQRMLALQSFVAELGQRLKGAVWLLATGQQQLEEAADPHGVGKLKDRFPPHLRVHMAPANIRDVVHKRLLRKKPTHEGTLRELFDTHRSDLKLHAFKCTDITPEDFIEVYPMLPEQIDLLMQITTELRSHSTRVQGDDHAIRGLLQLLGELFRQRKLAEKEVGVLVALDEIYEVLQSALDPDTQATLARVFADPELPNDDLIPRVSKAVSLLQLLQDKGVATTPELVASCLYTHVGAGNLAPRVSSVLEQLREHGHVTVSEKLGYKIQSSAGQEWQRERDRLPVSNESVSSSISEAVLGLLETLEKPRYKGQAFPWAAFQTDRFFGTDVRVVDPRSDATITIDLRFLKRDEQDDETGWIQRSAADPLVGRLIWVAGDVNEVEQVARQLQKSVEMLRQWVPRRESLVQERARLLSAEETLRGEHARKLRAAVERALIGGRIYFKGQGRKPADLGTSFRTILTTMADQVLPVLYPHVVEVAVNDTELSQLLETDLAGPSSKFMASGLGILSLDAGKYVAACEGAVPQRILKFIVENACTGTTLLTHFGRPPYGYPPDVVRACIAGLLRGSKIRIQPDGKPLITSFRDPDVKDLFRHIKEFRRAEYHPPREDGLKPRDLIAIAQLLSKRRGIEVDRDKEAIADALYALAPSVSAEIRDLAEIYGRLPGRPDLPAPILALQKALEDCRRTRQVDEIVTAAVRHQDTLGDGFHRLALLRTDVTEAAVEVVRAAAEVRDHVIPQLRSGDEDSEVGLTADRLEANLSEAQPWRNASDLETDTTELRARYVDRRTNVLAQLYERAEAARVRIKQRDGFQKLPADLADVVLRPIQEALPTTSPEAVAPALADLKARFEVELARTEAAADDKLIELLAQLDEAHIVRVDTRVRGREVRNRDHLHEVFKEIEERVGPLLDQGKRVRLQ